MGKKLAEQIKVEVMETTEGSLESFLGKPVFLMCSNYFYHGTLEVVNDLYVLLGEDAAIVFDQGKPNAKTYTDMVPFGRKHSVMISHIESFGRSK